MVGENDVVHQPDRRDHGTKELLPGLSLLPFRRGQKRAPSPCPTVSYLCAAPERASRAPFLVRFVFRRWAAHFTEPTVCTG